MLYWKVLKISQIKLNTQYSKYMVGPPGLEPGTNTL